MVLKRPFLSDTGEDLVHLFRSPGRKYLLTWFLVDFAKGQLSLIVLARKKSIYIRVNNPMFSRNVGKYNLHHICDRALYNTPDLKINNDNRHALRTSFSGHAQSIPTNRHTYRTIGNTGNAQTSEHAHRRS